MFVVLLKLENKGLKKLKKEKIFFLKTISIGIQKNVIKNFRACFAFIVRYNNM